jgi:predicted enzyme related to lactoylglutathione lyase
MSRRPLLLPQKRPRLQTPLRSIIRSLLTNREIFNKMPGPASAGLFIYAKEIATLVSFYEAVLGADTRRRTDHMAVLQAPDIQLVIHQMPADPGSRIEISKPPQRRDSALKFFFTVPSLAEACVVAKRFGGGVDSEEWEGPGFVVRNGYDPEGNVFHIREKVA